MAATHEVTIADRGWRRRERRATAGLLAGPLLWLLLFFVLPFYVVLSVAFGTLDPIFLTAEPVFNPAMWDVTTLRGVLSNMLTSGSIEQETLLRTLAYVGVATAACLVIGYPVAYFIARHARRTKAFFLIAFIAPFWISYMMRMLAWVNLLQDDGLVNDTLETVGLGGLAVDWLDGRGFVVVLGLVYGYVPYMILPLYAGLDRLPAHALEAARDLGAGRLETFRRVTLPLSLPAIAASVLLTCLPMLGDYFTVDLLSGSPRTAMVGNLINNSVLTPGQTGQAGAFVLLVLVVSLVPMLLYIRSVRSDGLAS